MNITDRSTYLAAVHQLLAKHFNEEELKTLCFSLSLDYDNLSATGKDNKARELVLYLERSSRITELKTIISKLRPEISWPDMLPSTPTERSHDFSPIAQAPNSSKRRHVNMAANSPVIIPNGFILDTQLEEPALRELFSKAKRIEIKFKFDNGYGGCTVLKVKVDKQKTPRLVKLGPKREIELEYKGFKKFEEQWPDELMAPVKNVITDEHMAWGGLVYSFAGGDSFEIASLHTAITQTNADTEKIASQLNRRLFDELKEVWGQYHSEEIKVKDSYERILPANLTINIFELTAESPKPIPINANNPQPSTEYPVGTYVCLKDFRLIETKEEDDKKVLTLDGDVPYRIKLHIWDQQLGRFTGIQPGEIINEICGVVVQTRHQFLQEKVEEVLDYKICAKAPKLSLLDQDLINPIKYLDSLLDEELIVKKSHIHGDLNLENILVLNELDLIKLIDFRHAREDHILHDILRLETGIITLVLPNFLKEDSDPQALIFEAYKDLHSQLYGLSPYGKNKASSPPLGIDALTILRAMRRAVQKSGWLGPAGWKEYYLCLTIYLLGSLNFNNVSTMGHILAFWGAATALYLSDHPLPTTSSYTDQSSLPEQVQKFGVNGSLLAFISNAETGEKKKRDCSEHNKDLEKLKELASTERFTGRVEFVIRDLIIFNCFWELRIDPRIIVVGNVNYYKELNKISGPRHFLLAKVDIEYQAHNKFPLLTVVGRSKSISNYEPHLRKSWEQHENDDLDFYSKKGTGKISTRIIQRPHEIYGEFITLNFSRSPNIILVETTIAEIYSIEGSSLQHEEIILKFIKVHIDHESIGK